MSTPIGLERRLGLGGIAAAGVLLTHWLAYLLVVPDPHQRTLVLQTTGHRYFALVAALLIGAAVMGLGDTVLRTLRGPGQGVVGGRRGLLILVLLQVVGFGGLEAAERIYANGPGALGGLLSEPAFLVGLALQVLVAALNLRLLRVLVKVVSSIAARRRSETAAPTRPLWNLSHAFIAPTDPCCGAAGARGPPIHA